MVYYNQDGERSDIYDELDKHSHHRFHGKGGERMTQQEIEQAAAWLMGDHTEAEFVAWQKAHPYTRDEELAILDCIDQKQHLIDMVRGTTDPQAFDGEGHYVPVTMRPRSLG